MPCHEIYLVDIEFTHPQSGFNPAEFYKSESIENLYVNAMKIETDLEKIKKLAKERDDENWEFRAFLKWCRIPTKTIDSIVHRIYKQVSAQIDCKTCANCCKEIGPYFTDEDIEKFSRVLGMSSSEFYQTYLTETDEPGEYKTQKLPCPFLKDDRCLYYSHRPESCASYPHLHKSFFTSRLISVVLNYSICPVVFNVYEQLKNELWPERRI